MTLVESDRSQLASDLRKLYERARYTKRKIYDRWARSYRLINNRYGGTSSTWMPQPRDSQVWPVCNALVSWMMDQTVAFEITPSVDPSAANYPFWTSLAKDLERVMASNWQLENYSRADRLVCWDAITYGAGLYKAVWDGSAAGGVGNARLVRVDPWAFYPDPNATSMDDMDYCVEVRRMSWDEFERRYPGARTINEAASFISGSEPMDRRPDMGMDTDRAPKANLGALPGGNIRWSGPRPGRDYTADEGVVVYEFWLRENREAPVEDDDGDRDVVDGWRLVVVANNEVVMDEGAEDLWECGRHPYVRYPWDDLGEFWGTSLVEHLAHPQIYLNRLLTALQHNAELTGNPIFIDPANSGLDRVAIVNRPGQRLRTNASAMAGGANSGPQWLTPPSMPDGVRQLVEYWGARMKAIAGIDAFDMPKERQGEKTVHQAQEAAFVRVRDVIRTRELALSEAGNLLANLVVENYDAPRMTAVVGGQGEKTSMALIGRHFWTATMEGALPLRFSLQIQAGSSRPTNRAARSGEAQTLRALGAIDLLSMLKMMEVPNAEQIYQRLQQEAQAGIQPASARQRARK